MEVFVQKRVLFIHTPGLERSQHQSIPPLHVFKELQCQGPLGATHSADGAIKGDGIAPDRVQACTTSADSLAAVLQLFLSNFGIEALGRGHTGIIIRKSKILVSKEPVSYHRILHDPKVFQRSLTCQPSPQHLLLHHLQRSGCRLLPTSQVWEW